MSTTKLDPSVVSTISASIILEAVAPKEAEEDIRFRKP